jgi:hypothetical protein
LQLEDELYRRDDDEGKAVTPLRELAREWLVLVPALWSAMFRPLTRPSWKNLGGACVAWVALTIGGLPGSLAALDLTGHLWGIPAFWVMLLALLVGMVAGASAGILLFFLPFFILRIPFERWIAHDRETIQAMDEIDTPGGAATVRENPSSEDGND